MSDLVTIIEHDSTGQVTKATDPKQNSTDFGYDEYLRLASINFPDGGEILLESGVF